MVCYKLNSNSFERFFNEVPNLIQSKIQKLNLFYMQKREEICRANKDWYCQGCHSDKSQTAWDRLKL
jgi:hypothetical protein